MLGPSAFKRHVQGKALQGAEPRAGPVSIAHWRGHCGAGARVRAGPCAFGWAVAGPRLGYGWALPLAAAACAPFSEEARVQLKYERTTEGQGLL